MAEPEDIVERVETMFSTGPLSGKKVMITAGPTRESIDPVRYISNHSTGKMGIELAREAALQGASVTLILGPVENQPELPARIIPVVTAEEMYNAAVNTAGESDILIFSAAVADFSPENPSTQKIKKSGSSQVINLKSTADILADLGKKKKPGQFIAGFALETQNAIEEGKRKLMAKNCDLMVVNSLADEGAGFGFETNKVTLLGRDGSETALPLLSKSDTAKEIFRQIISSCK